MFPDELDWPESTPAVPIPNKPVTPSRFELMLAAEGIVMPVVERPKRMRTHNAHEALAFAKANGEQDLALEVLYRAYWERGIEINNPEVIMQLFTSAGLKTDGLSEAIQQRPFANDIIGFDDAAYAKGVYNVPTFFISGERYAEQPFNVLRRAIARAIKERGQAGTPVYGGLEFTDHQFGRPYVGLLMIATIDGKIVSGDVDENVFDLGSETDHATMDFLQTQFDAVIVGANTIRATPATWTSAAPTHVVVSASGNVPGNSRFLQTGNPILYTSTDGAAHLRNIAGFTGEAPKAEIVAQESAKVSISEMLSDLYQRGVKSALLMGGSTLNAEFFAGDLVDEIFLTVAPKIKLGKDVPTIADGKPLQRSELLGFDLVSSQNVGAELFLRYRRSKRS